MQAKDAQALVTWMGNAAKAARDGVADGMTKPDYGKMVGMGADGTPTLAIDRDAEAAVLAQLPDAPIPLNVVSEESPRIDNGAEWTLVLDPVDGSRNIVRGIPFYCISMAVGKVTQTDVAAALILNLATGQEYTGIRGQGARLDGRPIRVRPRSAHEIIVATQLQYEKALAARAGGGFHVRSMGASALEACLVAQGALDAFLARTPYLRIIDVAAAALIVEEAGGKALDETGARFDAPFDVTKRLGFQAVGDLRILEDLA